MSESETRAEYIDPLLKASGWGEVEESRVLREFRITDGKIQVGDKRSKPEIADYILVYKNRKVAVIEAKAVDLPVTERVSEFRGTCQFSYLANNPFTPLDKSLSNGVNLT